MRVQGASFLFSIAVCVVLSVGAFACSGDAGCNEKTCADGCCGADGVCRTSSGASCGLKGAACDDCTSRREGCFDGVCKVYDQGCLDLNRTCSSSTQCCSGICAKGICSDTACKTGGQNCTGGTQCCSGICDQNFCSTTTCKFAGDSCAGDCCTPLVCDATSTCAPPCKGGGAECGQSSECCNNQCVAGLCANSSTDPNCAKAGQFCTYNSDCCAGLACKSGKCL